MLPEHSKAIPDILHVILDPLVVKLAKSLVLHAKTACVEEVDERGDDVVSEDLPMRSAPAVDEAKGSTVAGPNDDFPSRPPLPRGHLGRQAFAGTNDNSSSSDPKPEPP